MVGAAVTTTPMTPERKQEIREAARTFSEHPRLGFACCSAHDAADAVPELLAEVDRLHALLAALGPAGDRAAVCGRIADALAEADGWAWVPGFDKARSPSYQGFLRQADAALTALLGPVPA